MPEISIIEKPVGGNDDVSSVRRTGPSLKSWDELGYDRKRKVTQTVFDELSKTALERGIEPVQLAGNLVHRLVSVILIG